MRRATSCVLLLAVVALAVTACASDSPPQPARSVAFVPGTTFPSYDAEVREARVLIAYVSDDATAAQVKRLEERIAALREVQQYAFMTKDDCLGLLRSRFGQDPHQSPRPILPLPSGYWMLLHDAGEASAVRKALADDPALSGDGSLFSGVKPAWQLYLYFDPVGDGDTA